MVITYDTLELRGDHVLIKRIERAATSGLVLPDAKLKSVEGEVVQVGPGRKDDDGELIAMSLKIGDKVLFNSKWDDFNHHELRAIGADRNSKTAPLENPRPWWHDPQYHLVTERDVFGVLSRT